MTPKANPAMQLLQSALNLVSLPQLWRAGVNSIRSERYQPYLVIAVTLWLVGAVEIIQKAGGQRLDPRFWMAVAVLITIYTGARIFRLNPWRRPNFGSSKTSAAVIDLMSRLHANGLIVYHDPATERKEGGTYVVVGRAGIYAMEIRAGNVFGSRTIEFRADNELVIGGRISDRRPLNQAKKAAEHIRESLQGTLQTQSAVKPLVVFLNDWRVDRSETQSEVDVVNAEEVGQYLDQQQPILSQSEVDKISICLSDPAFGMTC